jgi:indolepyruvate ferredoxin oxidoreductase, beta subunit
METSSSASLPTLNAESKPPRAITIAIVAMGGEGGGVLADWIVDLAEHAGYRAQTTSVPGVAQRTGSTIYYIELFPDAAAEEAGKDPVLALMPVPGELDIVLASELMEAGRAIQRGLVTPDRTTLIASTHRVFSMTEKTAIGDGQVDVQKLLDASRAAAKHFVGTDFAQIAERTGSVMSAALFGALAGTGALPFARNQFEDAIQRSGVAIESSQAAFNEAFSAAAQPSGSATDRQETGQTRLGVLLRPLASQIESAFPSPSHAVLFAGIQRLADYQDVAYASEYLKRLETIRDLEEQNGNRSCDLLCEMGRYLALWMSYEDAIRVADLKTRSARFKRVNQESRAGASQMVQISEFLHPGVEEITDILPASLGSWLRKPGWPAKLIENLTRRGQIVRTTTLAGFLQLYFLAALRRWRRKSLRYKEEHARIGEWLSAVASVTAEDYSLALELAECPSVVKGYGDTHMRGRRNFDTVLSILPKLRRMQNAAEKLKKLREAALADDSSEKFNQAVLELPA